jgi:hypothetical protein
VFAAHAAATDDAVTNGFAHMWILLSL